jgi:putative membrane protein
VVGIVTFAQLLGWLFKRHHDLMVAALIGLMAGSLRKIWPWKAETSAGADPTEALTNVLPPWNVDGAFNLEIVWAILLAAAGLGLVLLLERVARPRERHAAADAG